jgi:hypothetical protein
MATSTATRMRITSIEPRAIWILRPICAILDRHM